jgi:coniferyl-aldehyde dehydrogenase
MPLLSLAAPETVTGATPESPSELELALATQRRAFLAEGYASRALLDNDHHTSIINDRRYARVSRLIEDARAKGALVIDVAASAERHPSPRTRRIPPTLILDCTDEMAISAKELFGPVLTVLPYSSLDQVVEYINARPAPLAAYWYGADSPDFRSFRARTRSGGVTRNEFALHMFVDGAPFGGVGQSGTGYYHGQYGSDTFSHLRPIASAPRHVSPTSFVSPPFSRSADRALRLLIGAERHSVDRRLRRSQ